MHYKHTCTCTMCTRPYYVSAIVWGRDGDSLGGGGWHEAMVLVCLLLAAPFGLSPLYIPTLCRSERVLVVSTEPLGEGGGTRYLNHSSAMLNASYCHMKKLQQFCIHAPPPHRLPPPLLRKGLCSLQNKVGPPEPAPLCA